MNRASHLLVVAAAILLVACGGDDTTDGGATGNAGGGTAAVTAVDTSYDPTSIEVAVGTTVTWTNEDSFAHTVTAGTPSSPGDAFDLDLPAGGTAEYTFEEAGTFAYYCTIHPSMTAEVVVQ